MGFHSMLCEGCGHPGLCVDACDAVNQWMNLVTVIKAPGGFLNVISGSYDGYGGVYDDGESDEPTRVMVNDYDHHSGPTVWHTACFVAAGCPAEYRGESKSAPDQGWFFDPEDHAMPEPKVDA